MHQEPILMFHFRSITTASLVLGMIATAQADIQEDFFKAVQSGQVKQLTKQMRPELLVEVDEPVLAAWMNAINEKLGSVKSIQQTGFANEGGLTNRIKTSDATIQFEHGTATSSLKTMNGEIIGFNVTSPELGDDWFQGPTDTRVYEEMGITFVKRFLGGQTDDAYAMCHPALQEVISVESFVEMSRSIRENAGALKSATFKSSRMDLLDDGQTLFLNFDISCEKATGTCEIKVQFVGMKGHLLGYDFE